MRIGVLHTLHRGVDQGDQTFAPPGIGPGPLPIAFSGTLNITGGTGRFASADGSADFDGMYCFRVNGGTYTLAGRLTR